MGGEDRQQQEMFLNASLEDVAPADYPLRPIRAMADEALRRLGRTFDEVYGDVGRPSIAPERLLRAQLLMLLDTIRSERRPARAATLQPSVPVVCGAGDE
jgi:transposase